MQPASQVDILIWRSVLRSSMSREYIKPIKPPRPTVPYKISSNYMLYSSLSLIFTSISMKMYYTHTRQLFKQPQHLVQLLPRFCKRLALPARIFGDTWDSRSLPLAVWILTACAGWAQSSSVLGPAAQDGPTSRAQSQACHWAHWFQWHQAHWLFFQSWSCSWVLNGQRIQGPRIQTWLCLFGGFISVTPSFICPKALSGKILATF